VQRARRWPSALLHHDQEVIVFVQPSTMLATGAANFLHVRSDSLQWLGRTPAAAAISTSLEHR